MNVELLRKIKEKALAYPLSVDMGDWGSIAEKNGEHPCGAVGCIAGTAVLLTNPDKFYWLVAEDDSLAWKSAAIEALEITPEQARALFQAGYWPEAFRLPYFKVPIREPHASPEENLDRATQEAQILADRIEYFINTGE